MPAQPRVSVVLPLYNCEAYVAEAVKSICAQSLPDFELLIVNDGGTDGGADWAKSLSDRRVHVIDAEHAGLVHALNLGLSLARGNYVARMDADDVARCDRLHVQSSYLEANRDVGVVCSDVRVINEEGRVVGAQSDNWANCASLRDGLLYRRRMKPIIHPSVMMRREVVEAVGGYREFTAAEDHDLWLRALDDFRFVRLNEPLLDYRIHSAGASRTGDSLGEAMSAMAAVNWVVRRRTGVDLFTQAPALFGRTLLKVRARIEHEVLPGARTFRSAQAALRSGRRVVAYGRFARGIIGHGRKALPDGARAVTAKIIEDASADASRWLMRR